MSWLITKYLITAGLVVLISEVAKRSDKLGAFIAALPTVTVLVLVWMYVEGQSAQKLSNHALYTFWYVLPSLPMFLAFPWLHARYSFVVTLLLCLAITVVTFGVVIVLAKRFGVELL